MENNKTDQEKDLEIDRTPLEPGPPVDREETTLTQGSIMRKRQETLPEERTDMIIDIMTLAMVDIIEGAARRPCFMGGFL